MGSFAKYLAEAATQHKQPFMKIVRPGMVLADWRRWPKRLGFEDTFIVLKDVDVSPDNERREIVDITLHFVLGDSRKALFVIDFGPDRPKLSVNASTKVTDPRAKDYDRKIGGLRWGRFPDRNSAREAGVDKNTIIFGLKSRRVERRTSEIRFADLLRELIKFIKTGRENYVKRAQAKADTSVPKEARTKLEDEMKAVLKNHLARNEDSYKGAYSTQIKRLFNPKVKTAIIMDRDGKIANFDNVTMFAMPPKSIVIKRLNDALEPYRNRTGLEHVEINNFEQVRDLATRALTANFPTLSEKQANEIWDETGEQVLYFIATWKEGRPFSVVRVDEFFKKHGRAFSKDLWNHAMDVAVSALSGPSLIDKLRELGFRVFEKSGLGLRGYGVATESRSLTFADFVRRSLMTPE